jgi:hypothetical protein
MKTQIESDVKVDIKIGIKELEGCEHRERY